MGADSDPRAPSESPLVTVCIPSFNYARFLPDAIDSVLEQSYERLELVIVDNGSTDGSYEIALDYAQRDGRIRVLTHEGHVNRGVNASLNLGLREARGAYFGLLPADDVYESDSVERRVALLEADPPIGFVYGTATVLDQRGVPTGRIGGRDPEAMLRFDKTDDLLQALFFHDFVPGAAILARRDHLLSIGGFDEAVYFNDWYITIRLLARVRCSFVPGSPVVGYRLHERHSSEENLAADRPRKAELFRALWRVSASATDRLGEPRIRALIALQRAVHANRLGRAEEARTAVADSIAVDPGLPADRAYWSWWLDPCHGEWSLALSREGRRSFLAALGTAGAPVEAILSAGGDLTAFVLLVMRVRPDAFEDRTLRDVAWTAVAHQLEAIGARPRGRILLAALLRAARSPSLLSVPSYLKIVLLAAGLWRVAAAVRLRASASRR